MECETTCREHGSQDVHLNKYQKRAHAAWPCCWLTKLSELRPPRLPLLKRSVEPTNPSSCSIVELTLANPTSNTRLLGDDHARRRRRALFDGPLLLRRAIARAILLGGRLVVPVGLLIRLLLLLLHLVRLVESWRWSERGRRWSRRLRQLLLHAMKGSLAVGVGIRRVLLRRLQRRLLLPVARVVRRVAGWR